MEYYRYDLEGCSEQYLLVQVSFEDPMYSTSLYILKFELPQGLQLDYIIKDINTNPPSIWTKKKCMLDQIIQDNKE